MRRSWLLTAGLALFALCFGQSHAIVHIHHSHGHKTLPFELSVHPLDIDPAHIPHHHSHDHHSHHPAHGDEDPHEFDGKYCKWFLSRGQQSVPVVAAASDCICSSGEILSRSFAGHLLCAGDSRALSDQWSLLAPDSRGPPTSV